MADPSGVNLSDIDVKIVTLCARQWGYVTRTQLLALGLASSTIAARVSAGRLFQQHVGVYAVGYRRYEPTALAAAAVLAAGDHAVLSHDSAAALWGLRRWPKTPEVSAPHQIRRPRIAGHITRTLTRADITTHWGIRVTTPFRTLNDIAPRLTGAQRTRLANDARLKRLISADEAQLLLGHRHNPTRSGGEDTVQQLLFEDPETPQFATNANVAGKEADFWFPAQKVVVELDHPETHHDIAADRRVDRRRAAQQILTVRIDYDDLDTDPRAVIREIKAILATRSEPS